MADEEKTAEPTLEDRVATLTAELAEERAAKTKESEKSAVLERTLAALAPAGRTAPPSPTGSGVNMTLPPLAGDSMQRLKQMLGGDSAGWTDDEVRRNYGVIAPFLAELAAPLIQHIYGTLNTYGDKIDHHDVELTNDDYKKYRKEVEDEREARGQRGEQAVSRKELTQIVKARHFGDEVKAATEAKLAEEKNRAAAGASTTTEAGGVSKSGPTPTKAPKTLTADQLAALPREERIKAMEDAAGDTPIP